MPYKANISRSNPILFVFLIDQSGSMSETFSQSGLSKAEGIADTINRLLSNLVIRGSRGNQVLDYCEIAVLGYGSQQGNVSSAFSGRLAGREIVKISEVANYPSRIDDKTVKQSDGAGGIIDVPFKSPVWFEPIAGSDTPMARAFQRAYKLVSEWVTNHSNSFPPIVINLTDGESTDGDPAAYANKIMNLQTNDGNALLFNCYVSSDIATPVLFPDSEMMIKDSYGKRMFEISSTLPPMMTEAAKRQGLPVSHNSRGFVYQANLLEIVQFLEIGTRPREFVYSASPSKTEIHLSPAQETEIVSSLFGNRSVVVGDTSPSHGTLLTSENQVLTPIFLLEAISPYIVAITDMQKVIDEIHNNYKSEVVVRSITQNSPISVSLDGASEAINILQESVVTWRRENAKTLAQQKISRNEVTIEVLKAETLERRANAAKNRAEAEKLSAEAEKQRQETEQLRLVNEKTQIEIERAKIQLALDILERIAPDLPTTEKLTYIVKLLPPLSVVSFSKLEVLESE